MCSMAGFVSIFATIGTTRSPISVAQLVQVVGVAHERLRDEVDAEVERAPESLAVAFGHGGQPEPFGRHVHALARAHDAAPQALGVHRVAVDAGDGELDRAVGEQDAVALAQVAGEPRVRRRGARGVAGPARSQVEGLARREPEGVGVRRRRAGPSDPAGRPAPRAPGRRRLRPPARAPRRAHGPRACRGRSSRGRPTCPRPRALARAPACSSPGRACRRASCGPRSTELSRLVLGLRDRPVARFDLGRARITAAATSGASSSTGNDAEGSDSVAGTSARRSNSARSIQASGSSSGSGRTGHLGEVRASRRAAPPCAHW